MTRLWPRSVAALCAVLLSVAVSSVAASAVPGGIALRKRGDGDVLTDARGMTLYTFDKDEGMPGRSACEGPCAQNWPAVAAPPDASPVGDFTTVTRQDGSRQWAFRGKPLYRYAHDAFVGASFGDGADTVWRVALRAIPMPPEAKIRYSTLGQILVDARGLTLYASKSDAPGKAPKCEGRCLADWAPLAAPWAAQASGDWSIVTRKDDSRQWAFRGQPLYSRPRSDIVAGELSGHGRDGFEAVVLEPAPALPPWATIQASDAGELIADQRGLTVYAHGVNARGQRAYRGAVTCPDGVCIDAQWRPFIAAAGARAVGSWGLAKLQDGRLQWTYKGQKLYTNALDQKPGEFKGIRFGGDRSWSAIMRSGEPMQGVSVGG